MLLLYVGISIAVGIVLVFIISLEFLQDNISIAVLQVFGIGVVVGTGSDQHLIIGLIGINRGGISVHFLKIVIGILEAVVLGVLVNIFLQRLDRFCLRLRKGIAGCLGGVVEGIGVLGTLDGAIQELISPGDIGVVTDKLFAQGFRYIQNLGDPAAVLSDKFVDSVHIEVIQLDGADLVAIDGEGDDIRVDDFLGFGGSAGFGGGVLAAACAANDKAKR